MMHEEDAPVAPTPDLAEISQAISHAFKLFYDGVVVPIARAVKQVIDRIISAAWQRQHPNYCRPRPRNSRVIAVQAKRRRLGLNHDGKAIRGLSRKQNYAYAAWAMGWREEPPLVFTSKRVKRMWLRKRHVHKISTVVDKSEVLRG